ncbi:hypothetical protein D3C72_1852420 [compost metagenome]
MSRCMLKSGSITLNQSPCHIVFLTNPVWIWMFPLFPVNTMIGSLLSAAPSSIFTITSFSTFLAKFSFGAKRRACVLVTPNLRSIPKNSWVSFRVSQAVWKPATSISASAFSSMFNGTSIVVSAVDWSSDLYFSTKASKAASLLSFVK